MINFNEELAKFSPALEVDDVEKSIHSDEVADILEILQTLSKQLKADKE